AERLCGTDLRLGSPGRHAILGADGSGSGRRLCGGDTLRKWLWQRLWLWQRQRLWLWQRLRLWLWQRLRICQRLRLSRSRCGLCQGLRLRQRLRLWQRQRLRLWQRLWQRLRHWLWLRLPPRRLFPPRDGVARLWPGPSLPSRAAAAAVAISQRTLHRRYRPLLLSQSRYDRRGNGCARAEGETRQARLD